ncbi:protein IRREGULAR XYLEM 15 [Iris pallida]|uniref:Protein IRREGULAR XYLEM 15 n=1 Tax=Iris pallida TaxID=29817 RepID=A0AAX6IAI7_IRIPA|nr:protein IRREGULAR XYLEM 15 [Iris pallida]
MKGLSNTKLIFFHQANNPLCKQQQHQPGSLAALLSWHQHRLLIVAVISFFAFASLFITLLTAATTTSPTPSKPLSLSSHTSAAAPPLLSDALVHYAASAASAGAGRMPEQDLRAVASAIRRRAPCKPPRLRPRPRDPPLALPQPRRAHRGPRRERVPHRPLRGGAPGLPPRGLRRRLHHQGQRARRAARLRPRAPRGRVQARAEPPLLRLQARDQRPAQPALRRLVGRRPGGRAEGVRADGPREDVGDIHGRGDGEDGREGEDGRARARLRQGGREALQRGVPLPREPGVGQRAARALRHPQRRRRRQDEGVLQGQSERQLFRRTQRRWRPGHRR